MTLFSELSVRMYWCVFIIFTSSVSLNNAKDVKTLEIRISDTDNSGQLSCKVDGIDVYVKEVYQVRVHSVDLYKNAWYGTDLLRNTRMLKESNNTYISEVYFSYNKPGNMPVTWILFTKNCLTSTSSCFYQSQGVMLEDKGVTCSINIRVHSASDTLEKPTGYMTVNGKRTGLDCQQLVEPEYYFVEDARITFQCYKTSSGGHVQLLLTTSDGEYRRTEQNNVSAKAIINMQSFINGARVNCSITDDHHNYCNISLKISIVSSNKTVNNALSHNETTPKPTIANNPITLPGFSTAKLPKIKHKQKKTTLKPKLTTLKQSKSTSAKSTYSKILATPISTDQSKMEKISNITPMFTSTPKQETSSIATPITTEKPSSISTTILMTSTVPFSTSSIKDALSAFTETSPKHQRSTIKDGTSINYILLWILLPIILVVAVIALVGYFVYRCRSKKTNSNQPLVENMYETVNCQTTTFINTLRIHEDGGRSPRPVPARNPSSDIPHDHHYDVAYNITSTTHICDASTENTYDVAYGITTQVNENVPERIYDVVYEARIRRHGTADIPEHMRHHCGKPNGDKVKRLL